MSLQHQSRDTDRLIGAYNSFGFKLLARLVEKDAGRNILVSPLSAAIALAALHAGAGGKTRKALARGLGLYEADVEEVNRSNAELRAAFNGINSKVQIAIANALWVREGLSLTPSFRQTSREFYGVKVEQLDFADAHSSEVINEWVRGETRGKIERLVESSELGAEIDLVLMNSAYFKGLWTKPFNPGDTGSAAFYLQGESPKTVALMSQVNEFAYLRKEDFQAAGLPYGDGQLGMYIFLPSEGLRVEEFVAALDSRKWEDWLSGMQEMPLEIFLPRFKMEYETELKEPLSDMEMSVAFMAEADFGPMGLGQHFISSVKHKTVAQVDEEGAEAAAVTAIFMGRSLAAPPRMVVDRPFLWAIRHNASRALLFIGVVHDPQPVP
jgi:serpin B